MRSSADLQVRRARPEDRPTVATLMSQAQWRHFHLDWRDPLDLLHLSPNLLAFQDSRLVAYLSAPPDLPGVSWLRSFCSGPGYPPLPSWRLLWAEAASECLALEVARVACLLSGEWMRPLLHEGGFHEAGSVIFFEWRGRTLPEMPPVAGRLRALKVVDLPRIVEVDHLAFAPLWANGLDGLSAALSQAMVATGIEVEGDLIAYQVTTASPFGAHLARLAVDPAFQHRGIGRALVVDLLGQLRRRGFDSVTLNTQSDNRRSQDLYRGLGFRETGQRYPMFEIALGG